MADPDETVKVGADDRPAATQSGPSGEDSGALFRGQTPAPLELDAEQPEGTPDGAARRLDVLTPDLRAGDRRLEPVLEPLAQRGAAAEQPAGERHRRGGPLVHEQLSGERPDVERQLLDRHAEERVRA